MKPKGSPNGVQTNIEIIPKESQEHPEMIRNCSQNHQKNHLKITPKTSQKCPEVSQGNPCPVPESCFLFFSRIMSILWKRRSVWRPPFFSFRPLGSPKGRPMRIGGHLLAPGGRLGGSNGHFWTCPKSAPERGP